MATQDKGRGKVERPTPTPQKPPTAVAVVPNGEGRPVPTREEVMAAQRQVPAGQLSETAQLRIAEMRNQSKMVQQMAGTTWGKGLNAAALGALARYLRVNKLDVNDIDVLGGRLYRNSHYFKRRLSDMIGEDQVDYAIADHVATDDRLESMATRGQAWEGASEAERAEWENGRLWALREMDRRSRERIAHAIPDEATHACIFRVKLKAMPQEFAASKYIVPGRTKKKYRYEGNRRTDKYDEVEADPVGDEFPKESVESRACRRCMAFIAASIPALKWREEELTARAEVVSDAIRQGRLYDDSLDIGVQPVMPLPKDDPYGLEQLKQPALPPGPVSGPVSDPPEEHAPTDEAPTDSEGLSLDLDEPPTQGD